MRVLLLNMPVNFNAWNNLEMPLGLAYIASELEARGHKVRIKDYEVDFFAREELQKELDVFKADLVGLSFRSASYNSAKIAVSIVRELCPGLAVVLGGHHAAAFSEDTLRDIDADFVVRGEGEYVMADLADALSRNSEFTGIPNLTYKRNGKIVKTDTVESSFDLDDLHFPAWHLLPIDKYVTGSVLTSRGCPFSCIYCDKGISTRKVRFRSPENIYKEIVAFEDKYKKGRIYFVDDYFFLNKKRLNEIFNLILERGGPKIKWSCQARVDGIRDEELLSKAKRTGCDLIIYGIETGDEQELKYMNKQSTLREAEEAVRITRRAGIRTRANFMIGFPISTRQTVGNSVRFAKKLNADLYRFFVVSALPNTVLWERIRELHPEIAGVGWDKFDFYSPSFDTAGIKKDDLIKYVMAAYLYVLYGKVIRELTIDFLPRMVRLFCLALRTKRIRGNISLTFGACVNLFLEVWFILRRINPKYRLLYLRAAFAIAGKF